MADRPILFSASMVRALLYGRKQQTRRVLKQQPDPLAPVGYVHRYEGSRTFDLHTNPRFARGRFIGSSRMQIVNAPYAPDDRLWVKETHHVESAGYQDGRGKRILYRATEPVAPTTWTSSLFMPRWASRLTLLVTDVRVERLHDISLADVIAEGVTERDGEPIQHVVAGWHEPYAALWETLHGAGAWDTNPWVAAISFRTIRANIDASEALAERGVRPNEATGQGAGVR